jgi:DNA-binding response OmpR family regulator
VLVVEDEALIAMLAEDGLLEAGATVVGLASTIEEALEFIEASLPEGGLDAAVLDINLQGRRADRVAERLAALGIPFLYATGYSDDVGIGPQPAAPVLHKPYQTEVLVTMLQALVSRGLIVSGCVMEAGVHAEG